MKLARREKILELIKDNPVETQEQLVQMLAECGFHVTQATVSRDISEMKLAKTGRGTGRSRYTVPIQRSSDKDRFAEIFKQTVLSVSPAGHIIVVKTLSGCASATAEAIDNFNTPHVVGTIAGDNTIFIAVDDDNNIEELLKAYKEIL